MLFGVIIEFDLKKNVRSFSKYDKIKVKINI